MPAAAGERPRFTIEGQLTKLIGGNHFPTGQILGG